MFISGAFTGGDVGGDVFIELLHLQKHRRMRGIQLLAKGLLSGDISRSTAVNVCMPLGLKWLLQMDNNETLHIGLVNHSVECLANVARVVRWADCLRLVKTIVDSIRMNPNRESLLIKGLVKILSSFDYQIEDASEQFLAAATASLAPDATTTNLKVDITAAIADSVAVETAISRREELEKRGKKKENEAEKESVPLPASLELQGLGSDGSGSEIDEEDEDEIKMTEERLAMEEEARQKQMTFASNQIFVIQRSIKTQLLPMLRRLMTVKARNEKHAEHNAAVATETKRGKGTAAGQKEQAVLVRPQIVSLVLQVSRYLPARQFHAELPRLLGTLAQCLV